MATVKVKSPYCGSEEVVLYGKSRTGKQRLLCRNRVCSYKYFSWSMPITPVSPEQRKEIVEMAMNGEGVRDTGRVLGISPNTVTAVLKNRKIRKTSQRGVFEKAGEGNVSKNSVRKVMRDLR